MPKRVVYLTDARDKQLKREESIYDAYTEMRATPGAMATKVEQLLMSRFGIKSRSAIFNIIRRVKIRKRE